MEAARHDDPALDALDDEETWDRAERIAEQRTRLARKVVVCAAVVAVVAAFSGPRVALMVGAICGLVLLKRVFRAFVEPGLRRRWIEREVERQLDHRVAVQRRTIEDAHAREVSDLAAGVAQEIRDPIHAAKGLVQQMGEDPLSEANVAHARVALDELGRVERSISHLLQFAREPAIGLREMDLRTTLDAALAALEESVEHTGARVRMRFDGPLLLRGDPEKLLQVTKCLLAHALDAASRGDDPRVDVSGGLDLAGSEVWLRVRDDGPGIPPEQLARIFSPFSGAGEAGRGPALALARKVVEGHGGTLEAHSGGTGGTEFLMVLPRSPQAGATS